MVRSSAELSRRIDITCKTTSNYHLYEVWSDLSPSLGNHWEPVYKLRRYHIAGLLPESRDTVKSFLLRAFGYETLRVG